MLSDLFLPPAACLCLQQVDIAASGIDLFVATTTEQVPCPRCQQFTHRRHSYYQRTLADLSIANHIVRLQLRVRRFFCPEPLCPQRVFTERLPDLAKPRARKTQRLSSMCQQLGLALGGEGGARLSRTLGLLTSQTTILRLLRQTPEPQSAPPQRVGIDDFAFRKGHNYGTIIIDLDSGDVLDLLPDRNSESVAAWLREHPTITLITRDRADVYADGARQGAPQATQVADRWHLLKNLGETLDEILTRLYSELCQALAAAASTDGSSSEVAAPPATIAPTSGSPTVELGCATANLPVPIQAESERAAPEFDSSGSSNLQQHHRAQRLERYNEIRTRHDAGQSLSHIARELGLDQRTVSKYARLDEFPERQPPRLGSALDAHREYLAERWAAGCHNRARLWRELRGCGYKGSYRSVHDYVTTLYGKPDKSADGKPSSNSVPRVRRREWVQRLSQPPAELTTAEAAEVAAVCSRSETIAQVYELVQSFGKMVRQRAHERFDEWLAAALNSGVKELVGFARGLQRDYAAVAAALALPFSNGPTEGHVNKLKVVKRAMYGRAKFDLLRKRVLCAP